MQSIGSSNELIGRGKQTLLLDLQWSKNKKSNVLELTIQLKNKIKWKLLILKFMGVFQACISSISQHTVIFTYKK